MKKTICALIVALFGSVAASNAMAVERPAFGSYQHTSIFASIDVKASAIRETVIWRKNGYYKNVSERRVAFGAYFEYQNTQSSGWYPRSPDTKTDKIDGGPGLILETISQRSVDAEARYHMRDFQGRFWSPRQQRD